MIHILGDGKDHSFSKASVLRQIFCHEVQCGENRLHYLIQIKNNI